VIAEHDAWLQIELEQELFAQRQRLAAAERKLRTKATKAALESQRIASSKIERTLGSSGSLPVTGWFSSSKVARCAESNPSGRPG